MTEHKMVKQTEGFFTSLGFAPLPKFLGVLYSFSQRIVMGLPRLGMGSR